MKRDPNEQSSDAEFLKELDELLGPTSTTIDGDQSDAVARGFPSQQKHRWDKLLSTLDNAERLCRKELASALQHLKTAFTDANTEGNRDFRAENNSIRVSSRLPLISRDPSDMLLAKSRARPLLTAALLVRRCAGQLQTGQTPSNPILASFFVADASSTVNELLAINKSIDEQIERRNASIDRRTSEFQDQITRTNDKVSFVAQNVEELLEQAKNAGDDLISAKAELATVRSEWDEHKKQALDSLRAEVIEFTKVETSINLWKNKASNHRMSFWIFACVFIAGLMAIPITLVWGGLDHYIATLWSIPPDHQFVSIGLMTVPTLAIAWCLRFLARIAMQNLALHHDAKLREAQIETYLRLLADQQKPINERERILALAAIFRPMTGSGNDDVSPPTVAEIINEYTTAYSPRKG